MLKDKLTNYKDKETVIEISYNIYNHNRIIIKSIMNNHNINNNQGYNKNNNNTHLQHIQQQVNQEQYNLNHLKHK